MIKPVCSYPEVPVLSGKGGTNVTANFTSAERQIGRTRAIVRGIRSRPCESTRR